MRGKMDPDCVFCQRIERHEYRRENGLVVVFEPLHPVTPGHLLAVPTTHVAHFLEDPVAAAVTVEFAARVAAENSMACNLITSAGHYATQTVFHLHVHIVPRRARDGLALPWTDQLRETDG